MEAVLITLGLLGAAVLGALLGDRWRAHDRIRRALGAVPRAAIRDAREGRPVRVAGRVVAAGEALLAPLTGRACVYWQVRVQAYLGTASSEPLYFEQKTGLLVEDDS